jgi:hypothetical protein
MGSCLVRLARQLDVKGIKPNANLFCFHKHRGLGGLTTFVIYNIVGSKIRSFVFNNIVGLSFIFDVIFSSALDVLVGSTNP